MARGGRLARRHITILTVRALLATPGIKVNAPDDAAWTPLRHAARWGETAIVQALLDAGADVNIADIFYETPLLLAASHDHTKIAQLLIAYGATLPASSKYYEWYLKEQAQVFFKLSTHQ